MTGAQGQTHVKRDRMWEGRPRIGGGVLLALLLFVTPARAADEMPEPVWRPLPAGVYTLDPAHASLLFRVDHLGMSHYTARFTHFAAELELDPADPAAARVTAWIDPRSLETDNREPAYDFNAILQGPDWLDVVRFPDITFSSTQVEVTGPNTARVTGELGLHGVTAPVELDVTFNGGYASFALDPGGSRIGFSARGLLMRSAFGIALGIPPSGSTMGVSDAVEVIIEAEFTRPKPPG
mgnify:CR=1 FL=1